MIRQFSKGRSGFTLIESLLSATALSVVVGTAVIGALESQEQFGTARSRANLESSAAGTIAKVIVELRAVGADTLIPNPTGAQGASAVDYQTIANFKDVPVLDGDLDWGAIPISRLSFEYEMGELNDGLDNNNNGLVDEGVLVHLRNAGTAGERRSVLCHGVRELAEGEQVDGLDNNGNGLIDEGGFSIFREGDLLRVRLSLEAIDSEGRLFVRSIESAVRTRN